MGPLLPLKAESGETSWSGPLLVRIADGQAAVLLVSVEYDGSWGGRTAGGTYDSEETGVVVSDPWLFTQGCRSDLARSRRNPVGLRGESLAPTEAQDVCFDCGALRLSA